VWVIEVSFDQMTIESLNAQVTCTGQKDEEMSSGMTACVSMLGE
jgi:hypothetical protein